MLDTSIWMVNRVSNGDSSSTRSERARSRLERLALLVKEHNEYLLVRMESNHPGRYCQIV